MAAINDRNEHFRLDCLLHPKSIVIIGASPNTGALGFSVLENLKKYHFKGEIYLVNPKYDEINGHHCYRNINDLPEAIDAAVLAIPRQSVLSTMEALAARKIKGVVIFSAGFAEDGEEGLAQQRQIAEIARENGMVVNGPNCLGIINFDHHSPLTFIKAPLMKEKFGRKVAIVSQSGAMSAVLSISLTARDIPLSYAISSGNEAVNTVEDFLHSLMNEEDVGIVAMIVEQFRKPELFLSIARKMHVEGFGPFIPEQAELFQIVDNPFTASWTPTGTSIVSNVRLALEELLAVSKPIERAKKQAKQLPRTGLSAKPQSSSNPRLSSNTLTTAYVLQTLHERLPERALAVFWLFLLLFQLPPQARKGAASTLQKG